MTTTFQNRLREATVVLADDVSANYEAAVVAVAKKQASPQESLALARLAFGLDVGADAKLGIVERFEKLEIEIRPRENQLLSVLAMLVLIQRFSSFPSRRAARALQTDCLAAYAVLVYSNHGLPPVHADIIRHARVWTHYVAGHVRSVSAGSQLIPKLPDSMSGVAAVAPTEDGQEATPAVPEPPVSELASYVRELSDWLSRAATPARIATLEEQQALLWWLQGSESDADPASIAARTSDDLARFARFVPGPEPVDELVVARLGDTAMSEVELSKLSRLVRTEVPAELEELCLLRRGGTYERVESAPASIAVRWLYDESQLIALVRELEK